MSSTYSGDHGDAFGGRRSGHSMQRTGRWVAEHHVDPAIAESPPPALSRASTPLNDDLDLDSLFKRLDKYTAEMDEVEARLRKARSASDDGPRTWLSRSSWDAHPLVFTNADLDGPMPHFGTPRRSSSVRRPDDEHAFGRLLPSSPTDAYAAPNPLLDDDAEPWHTAPTRGDGRAARLPLDMPEPGNTTKHTPSEGEGLSRPAAESRAPLHQGPATNAIMVQDQNQSSRATDRRPQSATGHCDPPDAVDRWASDQGPVVAGDDRGAPMDSRDFADVETPVSPHTTTWTLPPRTSSMAKRVDDGPHGTTRALREPFSRRVTSRDDRPSVRNGGFWSAQAATLFKPDEVPPVPHLSQSTSTATLKSTPPSTPLSLGSPREDQLRRELESFALHEGPDTLELRYKKRRPPMLNLVDADEVDHDAHTSSTPDLEPRVSLERHERKGSHANKARLRRQRSLLSIFQRRSPVEKLIDMYFDDEPDPKPSVKRSLTRSRKPSPTKPAMPTSPPIPSWPRDAHVV